MEQTVAILAEGQRSLQKLIAELATETRRGFDPVAAQFEETDGACARPTTQRERSRELDDRVDKLVLAIGELIRNRNDPQA